MVFFDLCALSLSVMFGWVIISPWRVNALQPNKWINFNIYGIQSDNLNKFYDRKKIISSSQSASYTRYIHRVTANGRWWQIWILIFFFFFWTWIRCNQDRIWLDCDGTFVCDIFTFRQKKKKNRRKKQPKPPLNNRNRKYVKMAKKVIETVINERISMR